jgi:hypothetical protein
LHDGRDQWPQLIKLVNWLRRRMTTAALTPGFAKVSYDLGNNLLGGTLATETVIWQRPVPFSVFGSSVTVFLVASGRTASGTATFALRFGLTEDTVGGAPTGAVVTSASVSGAFTAIEIQGSFPGLPGTTTQGYIKLTLVGGTTAQIKEGAVTLS